MRSSYGYSEEDHLGKPYDLALLKRLWPFLSAYRRLLAGSIILVVALTMLELALPYFTKVVIDGYIMPTPLGVEQGAAPDSGRSLRRYLILDGSDRAVQQLMARAPERFEVHDGRVRMAFDMFLELTPQERARLRHKDLAGLVLVVALFLVLVVADFGVTFVQKVIMEYTGHKVMHDLRIRLYAHIQAQSMAFFTRQPVARLVTRMTNDVQNMHELFTTFIAVVFKDIFLLLGIAAVLVILDWRIALAGFTVLPLVIWAAVGFSARARGVFRAQRVKVAEINTTMAETIDGIKTIQSFGQEQGNHQRFSQLNAENYRLGIRQIHIFAIFMPVIEVLGIMAVAILILFGGVQVLDGRITLGALVVALSYMRRFFRPLRELAENYNILQNAMASAERIFALLDTHQELPQCSAPENFKDGGSEGELRMLALEKVSFGYRPGEPVVQDLSLQVDQGQTLALVGPTGAGKTSVLNLIMRFYDPDQGQVLINHQDVRQGDVQQLRSLMALVPQEPVLFSGTIRENIFSDPLGADNATVARILEAANCADLVARQPQGVDTHLINGGAGLSSGERQLIAIARAFARDSQLILLDEATSYIDSQTEAAIHRALENLMVGRTCVIVAHRLSTARTADQIVVMHHGGAKERGTHDELMAVKGLYWRLNRPEVHALRG
jgi:ATP-binding cassette, subfamily B, multidrug efflux pump